MKQDTFILAAKAICYLIIGTGTPASVALAQWANSHEWPDSITWVVVAIGSAVGGASSMLAFFSGAYSDYKKNNPKPSAGSHPGNPE